MQTIISQFGSLRSPALRWSSSIVEACSVDVWLGTSFVSSHSCIWRTLEVGPCNRPALCPGQCSGPSLLIQAFYPQPKERKRQEREIQWDWTKQSETTISCQNLYLQSSHTETNLILSSTVKQNYSKENLTADLNMKCWPLDSISFFYPIKPRHQNFSLFSQFD